MKKMVFLSFLFIMCVAAKAQQDPMFSHYMFNNLFINPGFAGISNKIDATLIHRQQWVGFEGAPQTSIVSIQSPFDLFGKKHGLGIVIVRDQLGVDKNTSANLDYSYHLDLWGGDLGIGLNLGFFNKEMDGSKFRSSDIQDASIPASGSDIVFDLGFGAFYKNERFYTGLSLSHVLQPGIQIENKSPFYLKRHFFITSGYDLPLPNPAFEVQPCVIIKTDLASYQATLNAKLTYNKKVWGGLGYRIGDAVIAMVGVELANNVKIGYSYDLNISKLRSYNSGSHEFMLSYSFTINTERIPQKYKSVRFL